jgi:hypothetical protein
VKAPVWKQQYLGQWVGPDDRAGSISRGVSPKTAVMGQTARKNGTAAICNGFATGFRTFKTREVAR